MPIISFEPIQLYKAPLEKMGYMHRSGNPDRTKCYFREIPGNRRTHIHVREWSSWSAQFALLFRDYMRCHPDDCRLYAELKYKLMNLYKNQRDMYVDAKEPFIWEIMRRATKWSQEIGWKPASSDR